MSSNTGYIMTLANSIIGVGILAMPFCFHKCGILLSIILLVISNLVTRLACHYLMKTSLKARRRNLEFIASYVFGPSGKLMAELCVIGYLMGTCITYFVVVGDLGPQIVAKLFSMNHSDSLRTFTMVVVTIFCIIPLCMLRNIESLSAICISSILFYFCLVLKIFFESESKIMTTYWYENVYWWRPSGITQCLPIFSMALSCQMQIFEIYESLPTQTIEKMNHIVKQGTGICTLVYICVGFFGYVAFYDQPFSGNVLLSLTPSMASDIIQMGFVLSVAVSFPLVVFPCRASLYSLLYHRSHAETAHYIPEHRFKYITISMVLVALIIGIMIPSIELIIGLVGSTIGVAICIMFPASCFIKTNKKASTERLAAQFLVVFGFFVMILGTYANLGAIDDQQSSANQIQIDRLPDIHVTQHPTENIFITPSKIEEPKIKVDIGPNPLSNRIFETNAKSKGMKRKLVKPTKSQRDPTETVREINLSDKNEPDVLPKPSENEKTIEFKKSGSAPLSSDTNPIKPAQTVDEPNLNVANQLDEPKTMKKSPDSIINNDAIRKEEQEIEFNDKEQRQSDIKRTQEFLDELSKKNEENQRIVLQKINEIKDKVNSIAQSQKDERPNSDSTIDDAQNDPPQSKIGESNNQMKPSNDDNDEKKNLPLPVPVGQLLAERKSSSLPSQVNESVKSEMLRTESVITSSKGIPKIPEKIIEPVKESPPKIEQPIEKPVANVGRDLLSNSNGYRTEQSNVIESQGDKSEN